MCVCVGWSVLRGIRAFLHLLSYLFISLICSLVVIALLEIHGSVHSLG